MVGGVLPADEIRFAGSFDLVDVGIRSVQTRKGTLHLSFKGFRIGGIEKGRE
jgi:hypothetical protein